MENIDKYCIFVMPLEEEDGGGFIARVPDLPGCSGDGSTPERAIRDARKAIVEWIDEYTKMGREIPEPGSVAAEFKKNRQEEFNLLAACVQRLRDSEKQFEGLDGRISAIETEIRYLVDMVEHVDGWERFHIIMKTIKKPQGEMLLC